MFIEGVLAVVRMEEGREEGRKEGINKRGKETRLNQARFEGNKSWAIV